MRKYLSILFAVALFASCAKDIAPEKEETPVFKAGFESGFETKTYLNESLLNRWNADDRVSIFVGNTYNQQYKFEGKTGANSGSFSQIGNPGFFSGSKLEANYSVYPYSGNTSISEDGVVSFEFPSEQSYEPNSFGIGANTMFAVTENTSDYFLLFKNACGYLKVSLYGDATIKSVSVRSNGGEVIAGEGAVTATNTEVPSVAMSASGGDMITIDCGEGVQLGTTSETATDFYFVIPPVKFSQGITITAIGVDGKVFEKSTKASFSVLRNKIQKLPAVKYEGVRKGNITFADANFKAYCVENFDTNGDGEISHVEAENVKEIICNDKSIASMDEIEYFTALETLECTSNQLTSLDVSQNVALIILRCTSNQLTGLNVSHNVALTILECDKNCIANLDISNNIVLETLNCSSNELTALDVSNNTVLTSFECGSNQLTSIDVSCLLVLKRLNCSSNPLESIDVSHNSLLESLYCEFNQLTSLDVSQNASLRGLYCDNNQLASLDVSLNTALSNLSCCDNQLVSFDISRNIALSRLDCYDNQLVNLNVSQNTALWYLSCGNNQLTSLDVSQNTALWALFCANNKLANLDIAHNDSLAILNCENNLLSSLDISYHSRLYQVFCYDNPSLTEIWIEKNRRILNFRYDSSVATIKYKDIIYFADANFKAYCVENFDTNGDGEISYTEAEVVKSIYCDGRSISSMEEIKYFSSLQSLFCNSNKLTSLDVSNNLSLEGLYCFSNQLTSLILCKNAALTVINCGHNQLTSIDVGQNIGLTSLVCDQNMITSIDVSNNLVLGKLICYGNQLLSLDVSDNAELQELYCSQNPNLTEIWLKEGQNIQDFTYDTAVAEVKYK